MCWDLEADQTFFQNCIVYHGDELGWSWKKMCSDMDGTPPETPQTMDQIGKLKNMPEESNTSKATSKLCQENSM